MYKSKKLGNNPTNDEDTPPTRMTSRTFLSNFDTDAYVDDTTGGKTTKQYNNKKRITKPTKPTITGKKEILGKQRCIYKKAGDRKEYVKYKGNLITLKDYKKIISVKKTKNKVMT